LLADRDWQWHQVEALVNYRPSVLINIVLSRS
jgi:hypothetical protein